ncbi:MAG: type II secretion system major pseudopilin GspG [Pseudomonadota bacterium]
MQRSRSQGDIITRLLTIKCRRGFTLVEMMVVMVMIALLAALVGPRLFSKVGKGKQSSASAQIELLGQSLDLFRLDVGRYPTTQEGLNALVVNPGIENWDGPYPKKSIPNDPWGKPYHYESPGSHGDYDLFTYGREDAPGGEGEDKDVLSW